MIIDRSSSMRHIIRPQTISFNVLSTRSATLLNTMADKLNEYNVYRIALIVGQKTLTDVYHNRQQKEFGLAAPQAVYILSLVGLCQIIKYNWKLFTSTQNVWYHIHMVV
ncbi:hypothetical protein Hanom_Chr09g00860601 [Helianthus anomalus]